MTNSDNRENDKTPTRPLDVDLDDATDAEGKPVENPSG